MKRKHKNETSSKQIMAHSKEIFEKLKMFEIGKTASSWWSNESDAAKAAFLSALIIGFISHLFVYVGRYFGRDDMGIVFRSNPMVSSGRWFSIVITKLNYGYVIPLTYGILITLFLAVSAFYICKLFDIHRKFNAILIAGMISTFPSIANTNLFIYDSPNYHFAVMLGVLAVYITIKYKFGFLAGSVLAMLTLAIYQSKFNVILALCLFYIIAQLLDDSINLKDIFMQYVAKFTIMLGLGGGLYAVSILISFRIYNTSFTGYRGMSEESMSERLLSISGITDALKSTYKNFYDGFFGNMYLVVKELKFAYVLIIMLSILFVFVIVVTSKKLRSQYLRLFFIVILFVLMPFACNFSNFFDIGDAYGLMIYAFVLPLVFCVVISERCTNILPVIKSFFSICMIFVIANYIIGNNVYYLKAYYFNERTISLTTRILARVDPLISLSDSKQITFFGGLPNEYYPESRNIFQEYGSIRDGSALGETSYINYGIPNNVSLSRFVSNIDRMHGVSLKSLKIGKKRNDLASEVLQQNMPAWPAEGSVDIIDDVIVVNFGLVDVVFEEVEGEQIFIARHYVSEGHAQHVYEYSWQVYQNGSLIENSVSTSNQLYFDIPNSDDSYQVMVTVRNATTDFSYPEASIELTAKN